MKPLVIVLEGPDGAGKTTYADLLIAKAYAAGIDSRYIHNGPRDALLGRKLFNHYHEQMKWALEFDNTVTIIDRSFLSEMVYGPLYRGRSLITPRQARRLQRWAAKNNVALVGIKANDDLRHKRLIIRGEEWVDWEQRQLSTAYSEYFRANDHAWTTVEATSAQIENDTEGNE